MSKNSVKRDVRLQVAGGKKLEHTCRPGQWKEDRPKHLSTIDTLRSITHFTRAAQNPRFPNPNPGCLEIPNPGRVSQRKNTQEGPGSALFWDESRLYIPVLFWRRLDSETTGPGLRGMYYDICQRGCSTFFSHAVITASERYLCSSLESPWLRPQQFTSRTTYPGTLSYRV